jgi:FtsZ-interacting cell division protein ZipA
MNTIIVIYGVYALIALLIGSSLWVWFMRWREQKLYKTHRQDNIDAEREWHAARGKPSAKPNPQPDTTED